MFRVALGLGQGRSARREGVLGGGTPRAPCPRCSKVGPPLHRSPHSGVSASFLVAGQKEKAPQHQVRVPSASVCASVCLNPG